MNAADWVKIIGEIIKLIGEGMSKNEAVKQVARKFSVSESDLRKRGGF